MLGRETKGWVLRRGFYGYYISHHAPNLAVFFFALKLCKIFSWGLHKIHLTSDSLMLYTCSQGKKNFLGPHHLMDDWEFWFSSVVPLKNPCRVLHSRMVTVMRLAVTSVMNISSARGFLLYQ